MILTRNFFDCVSNDPKECPTLKKVIKMFEVYKSKRFLVLNVWDLGY